METKIIQHLKELEEEKKIKILMAIESGSRAWGFPSPDSDYDVRIIYLHTSDWYLSINDKKDTMDYFLGKLLDINGWDIRKALRLLRKSNATPFEWVQSPMVYFEEIGFRNELLDLARQYFQPYHTLNHYKGIARNSYYKNLLDGKIKLKKLFYVIRPIFAINWIIKKKTVPPMDIFNLMEAVDDESIKAEIKKLIKVKETANEDFVYTIDPNIKSFIENQFSLIENVELEQERSTPDIEVLNNYYRNLLKRYDR